VIQISKFPLAQQMLEVAGVVFGVLPLISMAFHLFRDVQTLLVEYKHLDRHMQSALRDIYSAKCLFMRAMDEFLKDIVEEERLKHMLDDLDDDGWNLEDLDLKLCVELGPLSEAVTNSLRGMIETMQDVKSVLNLTGETEQAVPHLVTAAVCYSVAHQS